MLTPEQREELKHIQQELRQPFPAGAHDIREIANGARDWVFLKWQVIRERLDDVCPEWLIDYSDIQNVGNDFICRCGITILGVRKEAIASVPVSVLSSRGKEMTRGSAADRVAAEGLKNAAELWGVGRYLDDQPFTIKLLWQGMSELSEEDRGKVRKLAEQYKLNIRNGTAVAPPQKSTQSLSDASVSPQKPIVIDTKVSNKQNERVKAVCEQINYPIELAREWLAKFNKTSFDKLPQEAVDSFIQGVCVIWATQNGMNEHHAKNSYKKRVLSPSQSALVDEVQAIANWMDYVSSIKLDTKDLEEAPV